MVVKPPHVRDVRLTGDGSEDHQVAGADELLGTVVNGDASGSLRSRQVTAETCRVLRRHVIHAGLIKRPATASEECMDITRDQAGPEEPDAGRPGGSPAQPVRCRSG